MELRELSMEQYAAEVLPLTAPLWSAGRDFSTYVRQTVELAESPYGKRSYRMLGFYDGKQLVASFKRYDRTWRLTARTLKSVGIGAVFTPTELRGRGYASAMLAMLLDRTRQDGFDAAFLFSDIHPQYYKALGFAELASRSISFRADSLPPDRIVVENLAERDWSAVRRCFDAQEARRPWAFERSPIVWDWVRQRIRQRAEHASTEQPANLVVRRNRSVLAYVIGHRDLVNDAYVFYEYGALDGEGRALIPALLRGAAGDLRRIVGWLPPEGARDALPRGSVRRRKEAIWMVAPLSVHGKTFVEAANQSSPADGVWNADHI